ncbi:hypothetical protein DI53_0629 [Sphingobacterium deserti]|uniref:Uncharacterized protein n=1 Tax=Sphingobacterium deserti TaxID=1229276 RepID=A0A0B8TBG5_9SPHI|nr:hypothetical protein DI53_0629 [Sphingobacterium deserti]
MFGLCGWKNEYSVYSQTHLVLQNFERLFASYTN